MTRRRQVVRTLITGGAAAALARHRSAGAADPFPSKPITLVVPWPPGGSTDRHLRAFAEATSRQLGVVVNVVNQPGAGGTLGPATVSAARPDGYTLVQYPIGMLRYPRMQKVAWDPLKDFTFIIGITGYTFGLVVRADSPYKTFNEYLAAARARPNQVSYASTGTGTSPHLVIEQVAAQAKVQLLHVPFKGNADSTQALLGGHVDAQSDASGWGRFVDAGQERLLVTFGEKRTQHWPDVPTAKELGYDVVSTSPYGIAGPKGMSPDVVKTLHDAMKKAVYDPEHVKVVEQLDQEIWYKSSAEYTEWARETYVSEAALIDRLGLTGK